MIVHIVLNDSFPFGGAPANRMFHYAKGLKANGVDCKIIIPYPHEKHNDAKNKNTKGVYEGIEYYYASGITYRHRNFLKRRFYDILGCIKTIIYVIKRAKKNDIIIGYHPTQKIYSYISLICKIRSIKLVSELNEYPFIYYEQTEQIKRKRDLFFNGLFKKFDGHIVISEALYEVAKQYSKMPIIKVPIIIDTEISKTINNDTSPVKTPYIFHSGTLTERKDGVCGMLEAFGIAKPSLPENVRFVLTGNINNSPDKEKIKEIINKYHIENSVDFVGYLDTETLRRYQKYCSLVIINKYPTEQNKYCFATKTGEYLAFARPLIITNVGEAMNYFSDNENAYVVEPNVPNYIAEKIVHIFKNQQEASSVGRNGYKLAKEVFEYMHQTKRMMYFFKAMNNSNDF